MANRSPVRVGYAIVAVVAPIASAHRSPLFRAHGRLLYALTRAGDLAAVLGFAVFTKGALCARSGGAPGAAGACGRSRRYRTGTLTRVTRRDAVGMGNADVEIGSSVATADGAVVFGARGWHRKARALRPAFAALRVRPVVAHKILLTRCARCPAAFAPWAIRITRGLALLRAGNREDNQRDAHRQSSHGLGGISQRSRRQGGRSPGVLRSASASVSNRRIGRDARAREQDPFGWLNKT
jgi:hypothetical protein